MYSRAGRCSESCVQFPLLFSATPLHHPNSFPKLFSTLQEPPNPKPTPPPFPCFPHFFPPSHRQKKGNQPFCPRCCWIAGQLTGTDDLNCPPPHISVPLGGVYLQLVDIIKGHRCTLLQHVSPAKFPLIFLEENCKKNKRISQKTSVLRVRACVCVGGGVFVA